MTVGRMTATAVSEDCQRSGPKSPPQLDEAVKRAVSPTATVSAPGLIVIPTPKQPTPVRPQAAHSSPTPAKSPICQRSMLPPVFARPRLVSWPHAALSRTS